MARPPAASLRTSRTKPSAAALLAQRGRVRPALIASTEISERPPVVARWQAIFAEAGVELRPQWILGADLDWPSSASRLARMLCAPWCGERPDALVVADDNLEQPALAGLMTEGVRVGSDMLVIAQANFPLRARSAMPVVHLGFDAVALLCEALARIGALRRGDAAAGYRQPATFADAEDA